MKMKITGACYQIYFSVSRRHFHRTETQNIHGALIGEFGHQFAGSIRLSACPFSQPWTLAFSLQDTKTSNSYAKGQLQIDKGLADSWHPLSLRAVLLSRHIITCASCDSPQFLVTNLQQRKLTRNTSLRI